MRRFLVLCCVGLLSAGIVDRLGAAPPSTAHGIITVDYPSQGSIFPPDLIPPLFQWRDTSGAATIWKIEVRFGQRAQRIELWSVGEKMDVGELDKTLVGYVPPTLTPEQAEAHTWRPNE